MTLTDTDTPTEKLSIYGVEVSGHLSNASDSPQFKLSAKDSLALTAASRHAYLQGETCHAGAKILHRLGWFKRCLPRHFGGWAFGSIKADGPSSYSGLIDLAKVDLPLARIYEGHVNAVQLVDLYADEKTRAAVFEDVGLGAVLGVWGANGARPANRDTTTGELSGGKVLCSGLSIVTHALIPFPTETGAHLLLVDVTDQNRMDLESWDVTGMQASASGSYDLTGLGLESYHLIGNPGDYETEPHFVGGVWRIAALELGGAAGVIEAVRAELQLRQRMNYDPHIARLAPLIFELRAALAWLEAQCRALKAGTQTDEDLVTTSISLRVMGEDIALRTISAAQQCIGLAHARRDNEAGRRMLDLSVYTRQVARDDFLMRAGRHVLLGQDPIL